VSPDFLMLEYQSAVASALEMFWSTKSSIIFGIFAASIAKTR
jgi:hypothetical protein